MSHNQHEINNYFGGKKGTKIWHLIFHEIWKNDFFLKTKVVLCQKCTIFLIDVKLLWTNHYSESYVTRLVKKKEGERGREDRKVASMNFQFSLVQLGLNLPGHKISIAQPWFIQIYSTMWTLKGVSYYSFITNYSV